MNVIASEVPPLLLSRYAELVVAAEACLQEMFMDCPYIQDRRARGLRVDVPLGPDDTELWAAHFIAKAGGLQLRSMGFAVTRERLIPKGWAINPYVRHIWLLPGYL